MKTSLYMYVTGDVYTYFHTLEHTLSKPIHIHYYHSKYMSVLRMNLHCGAKWQCIDGNRFRLNKTICRNSSLLQDWRMILSITMICVMYKTRITFQHKLNSSVQTQNTFSLSHIQNHCTSKVFGLCLLYPLTTSELLEGMYKFPSC